MNLKPWSLHMTDSDTSERLRARLALHRLTGDIFKGTGLNSNGKFLIQSLYVHLTLSGIKVDAIEQLHHATARCHYQTLFTP